MAYRGKYHPKDIKKYMGDHTKVVYRSLWERNTFRWLDDNPEIRGWNSEDVVIKYICGTDGKYHRYFIDIYFETIHGKKYLIEIKPKKETMPPKAPKRKTKRYISEQLTYVKNISKWKAATEFAKDNGVKFFIWDETILRSMGISIIK